MRLKPPEHVRLFKDLADNALQLYKPEDGDADRVRSLRWGAVGAVRPEGAAPATCVPSPAH
jgi:hypothetical protein